MPSETDPGRSRRTVPAWAGAVGLFATYFAAGLIGLELATVNSSASPVWPPTGIAIAGLILLGLRYWPAILLGAFLFNLDATGEVTSSALIAAGNTMEGLAGAWMTLKWLDGRYALRRVRHAMGFVVGPGLLAPTISATIGVISLGLTGLAPWSLVGVIWPTWWLGDVGGALIVAPVILAFAARRGTIQEGSIWESVTVLAATASLGWWAFGTPASGLTTTIVVAFGLLLVFGWAAFRLGPRDITVAVLVLAFTAIWGTLHGNGPLLRATENESLLLVQVFAVSLAISGLVMGAAAAERAMAPSQTSSGRDSRAPLLAVALGILPLLLAALPGGALLQDLQEETQQQQDALDDASVGAAFDRALDDHVVRLAGAQAFFQASGGVNRSQFGAYVAESGWLTDTAAVRAVAFNRVVPDAELAAFVASVRSDPALHPSVRSNFSVFPSNAADPHVVVDFIEPFQDNLGAWGFDIASNATRGITVQRAIDTGRAVATPPITLVQADGDVASTLLMKAVYHGGDPGTTAARRAAAYGLVVAVEEIPALAAAAVSDLGPAFAGSLVSLYDGGASAESGGAGIPPGARDLLGGGTWDPANPDSLRIVSVTTAGRHWMLVLSPDTSGAQAQSSAAWFVMLVGGVLSTSFTLAAFAFESTTRRARRYAEVLGETVQSQKDSLEEAQAVAHVGSWQWDMTTDRIEWTDELYRIFGLDPETFGASFEAYLNAIHPDDRQLMENAVAHALKTREPFSVEHRVVRGDTEALVMGRGRVEVGPDGLPRRMSGTAQDITELRVAENQFRLLLESAPDAMIVVDAKGSIVLINGEAERLFGYRREELLGQSVDILVPMDRREAHAGHRERYMEHAVRRPMGRGLELAGTRKDGTEVPVEISLSPLDTTEGPRVIATVRDITERLAAERAAREAEQRVQEVSRLRQIDRFKTQFINTAAHELRTPLMPLRAQIHMMQFNPASPPDDFQRKALAVMHRNVERLGTLVEDLLTVSHAQAGRLAIDPQAMDLAQLLDEACAGFAAAAQARDITFKAPGGPPVTVHADPNRITQVVSNLISNAFKFTPPGGEVVVSLSDEGDEAMVTVTDNGTGIGPEDLPKLFTPFVQVHDPVEVTEPGSGLGLYICKQLVQMHGGTIGADSDGLGQGASFWFRVPKEAPRQPRLAQPGDAFADEGGSP